MSISLLVWLIAIVIALCVIIYAFKKFIGGGKRLFGTLSNASERIAPYFDSLADDSHGKEHEFSSMTGKEINDAINSSVEKYRKDEIKTPIPIKTYDGMDAQNPYTPVNDVSKLKPAFTRSTKDIVRESIAYDTMKSAKYDRVRAKHKKRWDKWENDDLNELFDKVNGKIDGKTTKPGGENTYSGRQNGKADEANTNSDEANTNSGGAI